MALDKTFDAQAREEAIYKSWEDAGAFRAGVNAKPDAETFSIMIPPPNVTGSLHMGHAFNNTLMDILTRWHRMRGFDTLWQPGQDHAGIATQMVVERELAKEGAPSRREMGRDAFQAKVWEWKAKSGDTIINQLRRLGASCDWSRNAFTMSGAPEAPAGEDGNFHDAVIKTVVEFYNKGLIYRGKRLVNWDPHFETAISDLEVENIEVDGHMWHFKYPLAGGETYTYIEKDEDGNITLEEERDYISIATTRPETMLGDGAVAVHPSDERYAPIVGKLCEIPVGPKEHRRLIPIITDEYPDPDFGSGAVKITGAHDFNDYQVAKRGNIPMYALMDTKGAMRADGKPYAEEAVIAQQIANGDLDFDEVMISAMNLVPDEYRGLDRMEARARVVADIDAEGNMIMVEDKPIMQPFGDRSKVVIEPMLTDQWFVDTDKIVGPALEAVKDGRTNIMPDQQRKVYFHWLENIEPWCISRQLWWGHQVPVWYDTTGAMYCAASEAEAQVMADAAGTGAESKNGHVILTRDPDVLDTWFSSGLWPLGTLGWPDKTDALDKYYPSSVLVTGFDILFFWVARMMMMCMEMDEDHRVPFHDVYLHALVRDEKGKKMSKSLGNVLDPLDLIDKYGADAVRFTLASMAAMGRDLKLSEQRIVGYRNFGTKLWNAARFAEMHECQYGADFDPKAVKETVNQWMIGELAKARHAHDEALSAYRFNDATNTLYAFTWGVFCDWYIEFAKPLFQSDNDVVVAETRAVMAWVLDETLKLLHPYMPYITEELWQTLAPRNEQLILAAWPVHSLDLVNDAADSELNWVVSLIERIRSTRNELRVPAGAKLPLITLELDDAKRGYFEHNEPLITRLARVSDYQNAKEAPRGAVTIAHDGAVFALPIGDAVDVAKEVERLDKLMEKLRKEQGGLKGRLSNPKFVESAPEDVVADARARADEIDGELTVIAESHARMSALLGES